jgi:hypothetical protein
MEIGLVLLTQGHTHARNAHVTDVQYYGSPALSTKSADAGHGHPGADAGGPAPPEEGRKARVGPTSGGPTHQGSLRPRQAGRTLVSALVITADEPVQNDFCTVAVVNPHW